MLPSTTLTVAQGPRCLSAAPSSRKAGTRDCICSALKGPSERDTNISPRTSKCETLWGWNFDG